jgi:hypothetical protein
MMEYYDAYATHWYDEAPFVLVWGADADGDCIPDVSDNCPLIANAD